MTAPHLEITSYATDQVATLGTHFSLVLDVLPGPRVHVYAPGASGYGRFSSRSRRSRALCVRAAQFPKPDDYFFKPLNEHVPVYQRPSASCRTSCSIRREPAMTR